jgi:GTPase-activating protein SST2
MGADGSRYRRSGVQQSQPNGNLFPAVSHSSHNVPHDPNTLNSTKSSVYTITDRGQKVCGWLTRPASIDSEDSRDTRDVARDGLPRVSRDSNVNRLKVILQDAALRLLFKEFLRQSLCEENLQFYFDVSDFTNNYRQLEKSGRLGRPDAVRETLAAAYGEYSRFLAVAEADLYRSLQLLPGFRRPF